MKKIILPILLCLPFLCFSQAASQEAEAKQQLSKMDLFLSKNGAIVKFIDYNLSSVPALYGTSPETRVRKIYSGNQVKLFYQISRKGEYATRVASVDEEELDDMTKALDVLIKESDADLTANPDYLENKYVLDDGGALGYYVSKGKIQWYMQLERFGRDNSVYFKNIDAVKQALVDAKAKMASIGNK